MKNHLTRAIAFIAVGLICFTISTVTKNGTVEKWSSFLFGFSFPMFLGGLISLFLYFKKKRQEASAD